MKVNIYAVRDKVAGVYLAPVLAENDKAAVRMFRIALKDNESPIGKSPEDFSVERLGAFDRETGLIEPCPPVLLAHASDFAN